MTNGRRHPDPPAEVAGLSGAIAKRELAVIGEKLGWADDELKITQLDDAVGPGNILSLVVESEHIMKVFTGFGERGVSAERVAHKAADRVRGYLVGGYPVGRFLADQLMLPLALAGGGRYRTGPLSQHAETNIGVIERFLDVRFRCSADDRRSVVEIGRG